MTMIDLDFNLLSLIRRGWGSKKEEIDGIKNTLQYSLALQKVSYSSLKIVLTEYFELLEFYTSKDGKHGEDHITQSFWYDSNISGRSSYQN